ncbi:MAG: TIGR03960 family B12-binding radical SAM protein [Caldiserica bacterium]|nr:TIGR03960 family B12-binding radical SAM protein [Caldisericota bacterium]
MKDKYLLKFKKPYSYFGNELNSIHKTHDKKIKVAFIYPDLYEIGMSSLGFKLLYHLVNEMSDVVLERAFAPEEDLENYLRNNKIPLFTIESHTPINQFDLVAFSVQTPMDFTNILNIFNLSQIDIHAEQRKSPIIFMGGTSAYNPEPLYKFMDFFAVGEGENMFPAIISKFKNWNRIDKDKFLETLLEIRGIYIPKFFEILGEENGKIKSVTPLKGKKFVVKDIVQDLNNSYFPLKPVVPYGKTVMDRAYIELFRGCTRGCRFCQAGIVYRPVREKRLDKIEYELENILKNTGYEEVTFLSLSTGDYSDLDGLILLAKRIIKKYGVSVSLPSLRIDNFKEELGQMVVDERVQGMTFAIEAGSERLRKVINKTITEEQILTTVKRISTLGFHVLKLYYIIGLPTETEEDIISLVNLTKKIYNIAQEYRSSQKPISIHLSINPFMPEPNTVFQWEKFEDIDSLQKKKKMIVKNLKGKNFKINFSNFEMNYIETILSRGDRRLSKVLESAWKNGCKMDGWIEKFNLNNWIGAFKENNLSPDSYADKIDTNSILPWEHIKCGVSKQFLIKEYNEAMNEETTEDCRTSLCVGCGIVKNFNCSTFNKDKS